MRVSERHGLADSAGRCAADPAATPPSQRDLVEAPPVDPLHRVEDPAVRQRPGVVHGNDPRMLEPGDDARLAQHAAPAAAASAAPVVDDLQRDPAPEDAVLGQIDRPHAAAAELARARAYLVSARSGHSATRRRCATLRSESHLIRRPRGASARLLAELLLGRRDLAQLLEHDAPELAAGEGQEVGHLRRRNVRTPRPALRRSASRRGRGPARSARRADRAGRLPRFSHSSRSSRPRARRGSAPTRRGSTAPIDRASGGVLARELALGALEVEREQRSARPALHARTAAFFSLATKRSRQVRR